MIKIHEHENLILVARNEVDGLLEALVEARRQFDDFAHMDSEAQAND